MDIRKAVAEFNLGSLQGVSVLAVVMGAAFFLWSLLIGLGVLEDDGAPWLGILIGSVALAGIGVGGLVAYRFFSDEEQDAMRIREGDDVSS